MSEMVKVGNVGKGKICPDWHGRSVFPAST